MTSRDNLNKPEQEPLTAEEARFLERNILTTFKEVPQIAVEDATALRDNPSGERHDRVLSEIQEHAATFGFTGAKEERSYWSSFVKEAAADHLPTLEFGAEPEGRKTSVKMGDDTLYDRARAVAEFVEFGVKLLGQGEGPYQAFAKAGMSHNEALAAAKQVEVATGRKSFNQGERISINGDGTVTIEAERNGGSTDTTYGANGGRRKTIEHSKDGSVKETDYDQDKP